MKFLNNNNIEIKLSKSVNFPGFEVLMPKSMVIESQLDNPFFKEFKGVNILQFPKKMKGFRNNSDLEQLFDPVKINLGIKPILEENQVAIFQPDINTLTMHKLQGSSQLFANGEEISPSFINYGMHEVKLEKDTVIGDIIVLRTSI